MKKLIIAALTLAIFLGYGKANASELMYEDSCFGIKPNSNMPGNSPRNTLRNILNNTEDEMVAFTIDPQTNQIMGLTCSDLKAISRGAGVIGLTLASASFILRNSPAHALLMADLIKLGLVMSNPAVLAVSIAAAVGTVAVYIIFKHSLEECEQKEQIAFKNQIIKELESKMNMKASNKTELKYVK